MGRSRKAQPRLGEIKSAGKQAGAFALAELCPADEFCTLQVRGFCTKCGGASPSTLAEVADQRPAVPYFLT